MNLSTQPIDKLAIAISSICVAHCLIFPVLAALIPSFIALGLTSESFHFWMVVSVLPTSVYALALGCKKHAQCSVFIIGTLGLGCLLLAIMLGADRLSEIGEKALTLVGAFLIAFAHIKNFNLCQQQDTCGCSNTHK